MKCNELPCQPLLYFVFPFEECVLSALNKGEIAKDFGHRQLCGLDKNVLSRWYLKMYGFPLHSYSTMPPLSLPHLFKPWGDFC